MKTNINVRDYADVDDGMLTYVSGQTLFDIGIAPMSGCLPVALEFDGIREQDTYTPFWAGLFDSFKVRNQQFNLYNIFVPNWFPADRTDVRSLATDFGFMCKRHGIDSDTGLAIQGMIDLMDELDFAENQLSILLGQISELNDVIGDLRKKNDPYDPFSPSFMGGFGEMTMSKWNLLDIPIPVPYFDYDGELSMYRVNSNNNLVTIGRPAMEYIDGIKFRVERVTSDKTLELVSADFGTPEQAREFAYAASQMDDKFYCVVGISYDEYEETRWLVDYIYKGTSIDFFSYESRLNKEESRVREIPF